MRAILIILALVFSSTVTAFPSRNNAECQLCHSDALDGVISDPSDISLGIEDSATVTFALTVPTGADAAIALIGLADSGLDVTIDNPNDWTLWDDTGSSATDPVTPFYTSDFINGTTTYAFDFTIGTGATIGDYLIDIKVGISGGRSDITESFLVSVVPPSEIPVPAAAWLFGSGLIGLVGVARRRKPMVSQN